MAGDLVTTGQWNMTPKSLDEAMNFAKMVAESDFVPKDFKGKPGNVIIAMQMGNEIGLPPMQALQSIAVINGRPSVWGDAVVGIAQTHPKYEYHKEYYDEEVQAAVCVVKRKGSPEHMIVFSMKDVVAGGYDKKSGPWQTDRKRMMQMRARRAFRDQFADALKGLYIAEEAMDIAIPEPTDTPKQIEGKSQVDALKEKLGAPPEPPAPEGSEPADRAINAKEWQFIQACLADVGLEWKAMLAHLNVSTGKEIKLSQMAEINAWISRELDNKAAA